MSTQQQPEGVESGTVKPTGELVTDETAESAAQAARNANLDMDNYPDDQAQRQADLAAASQGVTTTSGDLELAQAMETVDGVRSYLDAATNDDDRRRRADAVAAAEDARDGDNRKGVDDAVNQARQ